MTISELGDEQASLQQKELTMIIRGGMKEYELGHHKVAKHLGFSQAHLSMVLQNRRTASPKLMAAMEGLVNIINKGDPAELTPLKRTRPYFATRKGRKYLATRKPEGVAKYGRGGRPPGKTVPPKGGEMSLTVSAVELGKLLSGDPLNFELKLESQLGAPAAVLPFKVSVWLEGDNAKRKA